MPKRGQTWDDGREKILSFSLGLMVFCTLGDNWVIAVGKNGQDIQASGDFQWWITNADEKKKIFCQCIFMGTSYPYPGIPTKGQEDGFKPTKSIKNTPQETEKVLIRDIHLCTNTKETPGHFHRATTS